MEKSPNEDTHKALKYFLTFKTYHYTMTVENEISVKVYDLSSHKMGENLKTPITTRATIATKIKGWLSVVTLELLNGFKITLTKI